MSASLSADELESRFEDQKITSFDLKSVMKKYFSHLLTPDIYWQVFVSRHAAIS